MSGTLDGTTPRLALTRGSHVRAATLSLAHPCTCASLPVSASSPCPQSASASTGTVLGGAQLWPPWKGPVHCLMAVASNTRSGPPRTPSTRSWQSPGAQYRGRPQDPRQNKTFPGKRPPSQGADDLRYLHTPQNAFSWVVPGPSRMKPSAAASAVGGLALMMEPVHASPSRLSGSSAAAAEAQVLVLIHRCLTLVIM